MRTLIAKLLLRQPVCPSFVLAWSGWRQRHQISAAQAHYKRHHMQL
jgi:hypothetical protein